VSMIEPSWPLERTLVSRPKKTAMFLAQRIVAEIADRDLPAGSPLPAERDMLEDYGVARGTLREALRFLEIQGVITIKTGPGGGPLVGEPGSRHVASVIAMMLQLEGAPFRAVLEARTTLEPPMAAQAALRISEDDLARLDESVHRMREHLDDLDFFLHENEAFHDIVAHASGNNVFALMTSSLNWIIDGTPLGVDYPESVRKSVLTEHGRIYRAIAKHDPDRASAAMAVHIADYATYLERFYPSVLEMPLRWDLVD
jgi:GntR family transcriptional regulator, transcriptional repressor for pyruvate dehydrogenase complex